MKKFRTNTTMDIGLTAQRSRNTIFFHLIYDYANMNKVVNKSNSQSRDPGPIYTL